MLEVRHIAVHYGDVQAVKDVSLAVEEGSIVVLLGPNAAGKSTTLRAISGVLQVRSGEITLDGQPIHNRPAHEIVERGVIHVPEGRGLFTSLTVLENLDLGAYTAKARRQKAASLRRVFTLFPRLEERQNQLASSLSGGEQQMCAIARGLMACPRILMIDEMSLGLAPLLVRSMFETVTEIARAGITVLLVEQAVHRSLQVARRGFILENGRTVLTGTTEELARHEHVKKVYLGM
ncbi:MAG: ABC transporter ATP-binding protein [Candidatus Methylomirabilales bacterium]